MRKILFSAVAILALAILSCNKSELEPAQESLYTIKATIDNYGTKSAMNGNTVTWVLNEEVALFKNDGSKVKATVTEVNGVEATLALEAGKTADGVVAALYPYNDAASYSYANDEIKITTSLDTEHTWAEGENNKAPMAALVTNVENISFKNAGALIALTVNNIPAGYNKISLSSGIAINGATEILFNNGIPSATVTASADANKKTAINFTATEIATNKVFYFPIGATETNTGITIELSNGTTTQKLLDNHAMIKAVRNTRYYKTINFDALGNLPTQLQSTDDIDTKIVSGETNFILDDTHESIQINQETSANIQIAVTSDDENFSLSGTGPKGNVELSTPAQTKELDLNVPNATVELKPDAGVATFETITATTAENTLIIPAGVTVNNLIINGGNVRVFGKIVSITNSKTEGKVTVYKEKGAVIPELDSDEFTLVEVGAATVVKTVAELTEAISQATEGNVITLGGNLEMSEILAINKAITLDGKGYKLTSTAARAINVTDVINNNVTIKNLVIETTGERGINIIQNSKNVTIENVNIVARNYSVNVAASAPEATVTITASKLTGLNTINIGANKTTMTVSESELTTNDNSPSEGYGTITVSPYNAGESSMLSGSSVTVENCEFITSGTNANDTHNISYAPGLSSVNITGKNSSEISIEEVKAILPVNENYFYGDGTLEELIAKCNSGNTTDNTIILVGNVTVTQNITCNKNLILDLNDCTMTIDTAADQGEWGLFFEGNTTIKNGIIVTKSRYPLIFNNETDKKEVTITDIVIVGNRNEGTNGNAGTIIMGGNAIVTINDDVNISATNYSCIIEGTSNDASNSAEIYIKGGKFSLINESSNQATVLGAGFGSTINVNNGEFDGTKANFVASAYISGGIINIGDGTFKGELIEYTTEGKTVEISIKGGTFTVDPSVYLPFGYSATVNNGIWTVSATEN